MSLARFSNHLQCWKIQLFHTIHPSTSLAFLFQKKGFCFKKSFQFNLSLAVVYEYYLLELGGQTVLIHVAAALCLAESPNPIIQLFLSTVLSLLL